MNPLRYPNLWLAGGLLIMGGILVVALLPDVVAPKPFGESDKLLHLIAFVGLMVWFCGIVQLRFTPLVAIGLLVYGLLIEFLQSQLGYRHGDVYDALFDVGGILLGWLLAVAGLRGWTAAVETWLATKTSE